MPNDEMFSTPNSDGIYDVPADEMDEYGEPIPAEVDENPDESAGAQATASNTATAEPGEDPETPSVDTEQTPADPVKRAQTPEENARFAEMRRQKELQEKIEREAQARLQSSPEYQMAQLLASQYGMPVDQLYTKMQEAMLQKQAQERGVPVEVLKQIEQEKQARVQLEQRLNRSEFDVWYRDRQAEAASLKTQYAFLSDSDINSAINYMLSDLGTTKMPLSQAVFALYGDKITTELRKAAKQEALAEVSGRKQGPLGPQGSKATPAPTLTAEERYFARKMGVSDEDYIKYRDM